MSGVKLDLAQLIFLHYYRHSSRTFFCVCFPSVRNLGLNPVGEDSGTAEVLSRVITERKIWVSVVQGDRKFTAGFMTQMIFYLIIIVGEDTNILPLFFPCGSIKREVLPTALRDNGKNPPLPRG